MFFENTLLDLVARAFILGGLGLVWIVLLIRVNGLRSLSKMTNFDFVMTIALGSLLAGAAQATRWEPFGQAMAAMAALFFVQWATSRLRKDSDIAETIMQNEPVFLFKDGKFCEAALDQTRVAKSDVIAKMREANCLTLEDAYAVVLETTGDVSVLHGGTVEDKVLEGVRSI